MNFNYLFFWVDDILDRVCGLFDYDIKDTWYEQSDDYMLD